MGALNQIRQKARKERIPLVVHYDLTYRCHQRCVHCYLPASWRRGEGPGPELNTSQVEAILCQIAKAGTFFLTLSGGEIFIRPDLLEVLEFARSLNFSTTLMTSGAWDFDKGQIQALKDRGVFRLRVSLYSLKAEVHDQVTGLPGSWRRLMRFIKECKALGMNIAVNSIAFKMNFREVPYLRDFCAKEQIPYLLDYYLVPRWDGQPHPPGLELEAEEISSFKSMNLGDSSVGSVIIPQELEMRGCGAGNNSFYLNPQGEVWPCIDVPWLCGRLDKNGEFLALWQNSPVLNLVRNFYPQAMSQDERLCDYLKRKAVMGSYFCSRLKR